MKKLYLLLCIFSINTLSCVQKKRLSNLNCPMVLGCTYQTRKSTMLSHCVQTHGKSQKKFFYCPCKGCDKKSEHYKYLKPHIQKTHPTFLKIGALPTLHCPECHTRRRTTSAKSCAQTDLQDHFGHSLQLKQMVPVKKGESNTEYITRIKALKELTKANHTLVTLNQKLCLKKAKK